MERCMECLRGLSDCCPLPEEDEGASDDTTEESDDNWRNPPRSRHKRDASLKDQQSTGRKRAATAYPLFRDRPCEWADASSDNPMGGGSIPIPFGCNNLQQCRHHGPDYNTLNNEPGNVHRICFWHHNNWHSLNNPLKSVDYLKRYGHG